MKNIDDEDFLVRHLSGEPPSEALRQRALRDSTAALVRMQRLRAAWQKAGLATAAALIATAAFLGGRLSMPTAPTPGLSQPQDTESGCVTVPGELVEWLAAAQLFRHLGMQERMARAVERAGKLMPDAAITLDNPGARVLGGKSNGNVEDHRALMGVPNERPSTEYIRQIIAQSFGD